MNGYELSRIWFDWCFENPEKISPNHSAVYFFAIEHCNRLGWRKKFGFPTEMVKDAVGIKSYNTYIKTLNDLVEWGFIEMIERSKNQYSANIVALSKFDKALDKALDKAIVKHVLKQSESIDSIDKPLTINKETINSSFEVIKFEDAVKICLFDENWKEDVERVYKIDRNKIQFALTDFSNHCGTIGEKTDKSLKNFQKHFTNWVRIKKQYAI